MSAEIAITMFVMSVPFFLYILPFYAQFTQNNIANFIIKRALWMVATFFMMLNASIMATFADASSLSVTEEIFTYMWFLGRAGWGLMLYLAVSTFFVALSHWKIQKTNTRMGVDND